jgi:hypothetical protein
MQWNGWMVRCAVNKIDSGLFMRILARVSLGMVILFAAAFAAAMAKEVSGRIVLAKALEIGSVSPVPMLRKVAFIHFRSEGRRRRWPYHCFNVF